MIPFIVIVGPTAIGKTEVSFLLAKHLGAEIVSCDSMLVYREPKIIVSKPAEHILKEIKHHFVNIISAEDTYNVFSYYDQAVKVILKLFELGVPLVACGGSGLYVKAVLDGIFKGVSRDSDFRKRLEDHIDKCGTGNLFKQLNELDPESAKKISENDSKRIIRALEVYHSSGETISQKKGQSVGIWGEIPVRIFGLNMKREKLYDRINKRNAAMFTDDALGEVENLLKLNLSFTAEKIIGVSEIKRFFDKKIDLSEAKEEMKKNTRNLAKRQLTWFKKDKRIEWIDVEGLKAEDIKNQILDLVNT